MSVLVIIQARMQSFRYPGKVLAPLKGRPIIEHVVAACSAYRTVVATTADPADAPLRRHLLALGVDRFGWPGRADDVLGRFAATIQRYDADVVVRITGDCPLHSPEVIHRTVDAFTPEMGYLFSHWREPLPKGQDVEVFTRDLLLLAHQKATSDYDREHVTPWMRRHVGDRTQYYTDENLSVDTIEDLRRLEAGYR